MVSHECTYVVTVWPYWGIIKFHAYLSFCHTSASTNLCHKWWKMGWNLFWRIILIFIQLHFHEISIYVKECFTNILLKRKCIRIRLQIFFSLDVRWWKGLLFLLGSAFIHKWTNFELLQNRKIWLWILTCSRHQSLQIFEFQFSKSLFLFNK